MNDEELLQNKELLKSLALKEEDESKIIRDLVKTKKKNL